MIKYSVIHQTLVVLILPLIISSCSQNLKPTTIHTTTATIHKDKEAETFVYECDDGNTITTTVAGNVAWLFFPHQTLSLQLVPSASGAKYSDGKVMYWGKGQSAIMNTPEGVQTRCENNRKLAIWEHAKLHGVDFRAVGNEPGWHLEIGPDNITYTGNYGSTNLVFPTPKPDTDTSLRQTVYQTSNPQAALRILIKGKKCNDTMSDETYESTVTVWIDDLLLIGCGRPLH